MACGFNTYYNMYGQDGDCNPQLSASIEIPRNSRHSEEPILLLCDWVIPRPPSAGILNKYRRSQNLTPQGKIHTPSVCSTNINGSRPSILVKSHVHEIFGPDSILPCCRSEPSKRTPNCVVKDSGFCLGSLSMIDHGSLFGGGPGKDRDGEVLEKFCGVGARYRMAKNFASDPERESIKRECHLPDDNFNVRRTDAFDLSGYQGVIAHSFKQTNLGMKKRETSLPDKENSDVCSKDALVMTQLQEEITKTFKQTNLGIRVKIQLVQRTLSLICAQVLPNEPVSAVNVRKLYCKFTECFELLEGRSLGEWADIEKHAGTTINDLRPEEFSHGLFNLLDEDKVEFMEKNLQKWNPVLEFIVETFIFMCSGEPLGKPDKDCDAEDLLKFGGVEARCTVAQNFTRDPRRESLQRENLRPDHKSASVCSIDTLTTTPLKKEMAKAFEQMYLGVKSKVLLMLDTLEQTLKQVLLHVPGPKDNLLLMIGEFSLNVTQFLFGTPNDKTVNIERHKIASIEGFIPIDFNFGLYDLPEGKRVEYIEKKLQKWNEDLKYILENFIIKPEREPPKKQGTW